MVLLDIGFEGPVLSRPEILRRAALSKWDDVIIDEVFVIAGRIVIKFVFRDFFAGMPGHRYLLPMEVKVGCIYKSGPDGKDLSSRRIVLRLQKDHGRTVFAYGRSFLAQIAPANVGTLLWVVPI